MENGNFYAKLVLVFRVTKSNDNFMFSFPTHHKTLTRFELFNQFYFF